MILDVACCYLKVFLVIYKYKICLKVFWFSKDNPTGHSERKKKKRQTEEEVERQYQRVDRHGLCQLGQLKTGQAGRDCCKFICGAPTTSQGYVIEIEKNR